MVKTSIDKRIGTILGPAAAGKDTVLAVLGTNPAIKRIVNDTTRLPRPGEVEGREYHFISDDVYEDLNCSGKYFTTNTEKGRKYGVRRTELSLAWAKSKVPVGHFGLVDHTNIWHLSDSIDLRSKSIFLTVPDFSVWRSRMEGRVSANFISESEMQLRASEAAKEYKFLAQNIGRFAVVISNEGNFGQTVDDCANFILKDIKPALDKTIIRDLIGDFASFNK